MLRTLVVRTKVGLGVLRKSVRVNSTRTLLVQARRGKLHKLQKYPQTAAQPCVSYNQVRYYADYPEHTKVALPALSPTMEEGTLISWAKKEGDKLNEGDLLAEIETDKATMAFETPEEGYLAKILIPAGSKGVPIGKLVCIIVQEEKDIAAFKNYKDDSSAAPKAAAAAAPSPGAAAPAPPTPGPVSPPPAGPAADAGGRVYASPMAKKLAEQRNIRLQGKGTGLYDSITSADLNKMPAAGQPAASASAPRASATSPPPPPGQFEIIPVSNMRAVIARRLLDSKQNVPHYYVSVTVNVDKLLALKKKFDKINEKEKIRISVNDLIIKATALSSVKVPEANSMWMGDTIKQYKNVDVSVAVATDKGLLTPIIFEANNKGLIQISKEVKLLAGKAREGKLQPHEFQGGTISVSNLGMFNVDHFTAIINPPQSCILAIGRTSKQLVLDDKAEKGFREASFMTVCLSSDHRIVDGAVAARWLQHFRMCIEEPETMLL